MRILLVGFIAGFMVAGCSDRQPVEKNTNENTGNSENADRLVKRDSFGLPIDSTQVFDHKVRRNESLYVILDKLDLSPREIYSTTEKASEVLDFGNLKPGQRYRTYAPADSDAGISRMVWQPNKLEYVVFDWERGSPEVYRAAHPLRKKQEILSSRVSNSLYQSIIDKGASPMLAYKLAEVFAWQVDFFGLRPGDSFRVLYNKQFVNRDFWSIGEVLAAEFDHRGETYRAYKFSKGETEGYFTEDGQSVEKALLKAPFKFSQRISSHFSHSRYHPILKKRIPHYGVDYAAPHGTPVLAVGDGTVAEARYRGANGNIVKISHNASYRTAYLHLSGFSSGIHRGASVKQGQIIGYVGNTGRSTGPHLDYRLYKNDRPVNPLAVELPSSDSVPDGLMKEFTKVRDSLNRQLTAGSDSPDAEMSARAEED